MGKRVAIYYVRRKVGDSTDVLYWQQLCSQEYLYAICCFVYRGRFDKQRPDFLCGASAKRRR